MDNIVNYSTVNLVSILLGLFMAGIVGAIEFAGWKIINRNKKKKAYIESDNSIIKSLFDKFKELKKEQYNYKYRKTYRSILKEHEIDQIKHARELMEADLGSTVLWGIFFTVFNAIISKAVAMVASLYSYSLYNQDEKATKICHENVENIVLISILLFLAFFIYKSINNYMRGKYLVSILQEEIEKQEKEEKERQNNQIRMKKVDNTNMKNQERIKKLDSNTGTKKKVKEHELSFAIRFK